jgi:hypothetical protein
MISALAWVPAGVADPHPKKYELSATEQELVALMQTTGGDITQVEAQLAQKMQQQQPTKIELPPCTDELPADLRMDEYSDNEDNGDMAVGQLLMGQSGELPFGDDDEEDNEDAAEESDNEEEDVALIDDYEESDSDDDLADVPDTREFEPLNVEGLENMGISHVGANGPMYMNDLAGNDDDDDESEAEDIRLTPDDALMCVAKTEDVSLT